MSLKAESCGINKAHSGIQILALQSPPGTQVCKITCTGRLLLQAFVRKVCSQDISQFQCGSLIERSCNHTIKLFGNFRHLLIFLIWPLIKKMQVWFLPCLFMCHWPATHVGPGGYRLVPPTVCERDFVCSKKIVKLVRNILLAICQ